MWEPYPYPYNTFVYVGGWLIISCLVGLVWHYVSQVFQACETFCVLCAKDFVNGTFYFLQKRFSASWLTTTSGKAPECMPAVQNMSIDEDDTAENVVAVSSAGCSNNGAETVYAPIRAFVPKRIWQYCLDAFLNSAVVSTHAEVSECVSSFLTAHQHISVPCIHSVLFIVW